MPLTLKDFVENNIGKRPSARTAAQLRAKESECEAELTKLRKERHQIEPWDAWFAGAKAAWTLWEKRWNQRSE